MVITECKICGKTIKRGGDRTGIYCSLACKAQAQRDTKPVSREWLYQKYITEELGTYQIGQLVHRDAKRVYDWLIDFGIPIRERKWKITITDDNSKLYHNRNWLYEQYVTNQRSMSEIAIEQECTCANIRFFLKKFSITRCNISEARFVKHWGSSGPKNSMYGRVGDRSPSWKGGITPERQKFYESDEWKVVSQEIWIRDKGTCQRCQVKRKSKDRAFHIHHIVSFAVPELRAEPTNLVLLCPKCHRFVHSRKNVNKEFRKEVLQT
jgi:hypothetical protein